MGVMFKKITIIGDGAMGSVCSMLLCANGADVTLWGHDRAQLAEIERRRENVFFLPGYKLPEPLRFETDGARATAGAELLVCAVPCQYIRRVWTGLRDQTPPRIPIVSVTKGLERQTHLRPTQILAELLGPAHRYAVLSGPTIADEVAAGLPATATMACEDADLACQLQETFNTPMFRVYTNDDLVGVELAGAMKNVIAIAAGCIDGIGAGDNCKAALVCRGLAEIERLGVAMGARQKTFAGLSGLGDLVTTCISPKGRNRSFGERLGKGMSAEQAIAATRSVVEGAATCESVVELAGRYGVEMPISQAVYDVIHGHKSVREGIADLMSRSLKAE
jgi:glycerol-3-phosphate dehydrogenase (NAD(P)+)